ncbi:MAG: TRAP-type C4-dicarboxylate transport system permease small subunit [bacterium]|jgi:TRAP-type C4-dicarboxylate transport system permease small subunit
MATHESVHADTASDKFIRTVGWISTLSGWISAGMIVVAVLITCQMIFVRSVLNHSTIWQTEAVVYLVVAATLLGLPYVQQLRGHVNVDLIPLYLPLPLRRGLHLFTLSLSILIIGVMVYYGYDYWHVAFERNWRSDTIWGVRLWIPYLALPVGFGLLMLQLISDLLAVATKLDKPFWLEKER